jgi:hypothetical protein
MRFRMPSDVSTILSYAGIRLAVDECGIARENA